MHMPTGADAVDTGTITGNTSRGQQLAWWVVLLCITAVGIALRLGGLAWLIGVGESPGFTFHPDERAALWAADLEAGSQDGYPLGMTTHVYAVAKVVSRFAEPNLVVIARAVSVFYAAAMIVLVALVARSWGFTRGVALLAAAFLAVAPLHIVNSFFGTSDTAALFLLFLTLFTATIYLRTRHQLALVATAVFTGAALGMKFYITAFVPLFAILAAQERRRFLDQSIAAAMIVTGAFAIASHFNFPPWKMRLLYDMLAYDTMVIAGGASPVEQFAQYGLASTPAFGIALWILTVVGTVLLGRIYVPRALGYVRDLVRVGIPGAIPALLKQPAVFWVGAFALHAALILSAQFHAARHLLVFVPLGCLLAAQGVFLLGHSLRVPRAVVAVVLAGVFVYQVQDAFAIERSFASDVRNDVARWIASELPLGSTVGRFMPYNAVKGTQELPDEAALGRVDYFLTCDLEYGRYLASDDASQIHHAASQTRLEFFRSLFAGKTDLKLVRDFQSRPSGFEFRLIANGVLNQVGTFVPRRCMVFGRDASRDGRRVIVSRTNGW